MVKLYLEDDRAIRMQVDSGATCKVIPEYMVPATCQISCRSPTLSAYGGSHLDVVGCTRLTLTNPANMKQYDEEFVVVKGNHLPLLGLRTSLSMKMIEVCHENIAAIKTEPLTIETIKNDFKEVFTGLGDL